MADVKELRSLPINEIRERESALRREVFDLRMKVANDATALKRYREARRELAQILTVRGEHSRSERPQS